VKGQLLPYDDDLDAKAIDVLLDEIAASKRAKRYQVKGRSYLFLPKLARHQRLDADKVPSRLPGPDEADPDPDESGSRPDKSAPDPDELSLKHVACSREHVAGGRESARARGDEPEPEPPQQVQRPDGLTSIPDDFEPTDSMRRWAIATFGDGLDLNFETDQFAAHYRSTGARRKSWPDQWQKWVRDSAKRRYDQSLRVTARASPNGVIDRRQQATDAQFDRAMQRAAAREEAAGDST
jgi:hypothetical protein